MCKNRKKALDILPNLFTIFDKNKVKMYIL